MPRFPKIPIKFLIGGILIFVLIIIIWWVFDIVRNKNINVESFVLIESAEGENYGTGFFIDGEPGQCTVLTSEDVVENRKSLKLTPEKKKNKDKKSFNSSNIIKFSEFGLNSKSALIIFKFIEQKSNQEKCPYPSLTLSGDEPFTLPDNKLLPLEANGMICGYLVEKNNNEKSLVPCSQVKFTLKNPNSNEKNWLVTSLGPSEKIEQRIGGAISVTRK